MANTKKVIKNSGIYGLVSILQKAIGFFLLPLYTIYLTTEDYGITSVVTSIIAFLIVCYMLSLDGAVTRFYYEYKDDEEKVKEFWGTNIVFILLISILLTSVIIVFRKYLLMPMAKGIDFYPYLVLGLVSITLNPVYNIFQATLQARQMGARYGLNNLLYFVIKIVLTIVLVVFFKQQAKGVLLASAITDILFFIYTVVCFLPTIKLTINKKYLYESLRYSLPLVPHSLSGWAMSMLDRVFLNNLKTTATVGIYNIGFQFGNILSVLTAAVNQAYVPWFFEKMNEGEEGRKTIVKFAENAVMLYGFAAMLISLFGSEILRLMVTKNFREGWTVIPFLSFAFVFNGIYYFFVNPLFYNKRGTKFIPVGTFTSAILNAILNIFLIPKYGIIGASLASMISMFIATILILIISIRIENINLNWFKMYVTAFFFFGLSLVSFLNKIFNQYTLLAIKILVVFICIFLFRLIYKEEYSLIIQVVKKRIIKYKI